MLSKEIRDMLRENERFNRIFERYDETREFDYELGRCRVRKSYSAPKGRSMLTCRKSGGVSR